MKAESIARNHRDFENYRDLVFILVQKEIKVRYKGKILGYLWSIANPLAYGCIYYIVFSLIMQVQIPNYPLVLMSGLFPWQWFSNAVGSSPRLFLGNASILKKINFPRSLISLAIMLNHMIHFLLSIPVIFLFLFIYRQAPTLDWLYGFPMLLVIQLIMVFGVSLFLASINVFVRDLERLSSILMTFVFYFTPIIYPLDLVPHRYKFLLAANPVAPLIICWRELILKGKLDWAYLGISALYAVLFFALGYYVYRKLSPKFAEAL
ncbi:MAG TPA: ABC transporter permease [Chroococcidiopsis sp.]